MLRQQQHGWQPTPRPTVQGTHGMTSCSEWTGVTLSLLLEEVGVQAGASWIVAEGADAAKMTRSIPLDKAIDDALVAYAQNGEPLRPEQGFPLRLFLPGWEGNANVKWLRRLKVVDQPVHDAGGNVEVHRPDAGRSRAPVHVRDGGEIGDHVSVRRTEARRRRVSRNQRPRLVGPRPHRSGRGFDRRRSDVENAALQEPLLPLAHTRFRFDWHWDGLTPSLRRE